MSLPDFTIHLPPCLFLPPSPRSDVDTITGGWSWFGILSLICPDAVKETCLGTAKSVDQQLYTCFISPTFYTINYVKIKFSTFQYITKKILQFLTKITLWEDHNFITIFSEFTLKFFFYQPFSSLILQIILFFSRSKEQVFLLCSRELGHIFSDDQENDWE